MSDQEKIKYIAEDVEVEIHDCKKGIVEAETQIKHLESKIERLREAKQLAERLQNRLKSYNAESQ